MTLRHKPGSHCHRVYDNFTKYFRIPGFQTVHLLSNEPISGAYLRTFSSGCGMAAALGFPEVCACSSEPLFAQQYTLRDAQGTPLRKQRYRLHIGSDVTVSGTTDSNGRTQRIHAEKSLPVILEIMQ